MVTVNQLSTMTQQYIDAKVTAAGFQDWFFEASMGDLSVNAASLANKIEGLLAEASHIGWSELSLREELATAIRPFESYELESYQRKSSEQIPLASGDLHVSR